MNHFILKEKISEAIQERKVIAAIFHTFNFEPEFFENHVMPMLLPQEKSKNFSAEIIHNKILWRNCLKDGSVPPIAVFCDFFAKSKTEAPTLGYDIFCIKTPAAPGNICNFHPKHIFILVEDDDNLKSLIMVTGSGNITPAGWCSNFEAFTIEDIPKNKKNPNPSTTNIIQDILNETWLLTKGEYSNAQFEINEFLKYVDFKGPYFNSLKGSFKNFIEEKMNGDKINEIEIISPYFSNDIGLIEYLKGHFTKKIKCLIPTTKNNEIQVEKDTFFKFKEAGLEWCFWKNNEQEKRAEEVRNQHAKIYRFYGVKQTYTIIGSVNFTNPAWAHFENSKKNKANVESAFMYVEKTSEKLLKKPIDFDIDKYTFCVKNELEKGELVNLNSRNSPDVEFIIDWQMNTLSVKAKKVSGTYRFKTLFNEGIITEGTYSDKKELNKKDKKHLSRNSLISLIETDEKVNELSEHSYYPQQINIENKPLGYRFNSYSILKYWDHLEDEDARERRTRKLAEQVTDESGIVNEGALNRVSMLNEMAQGFASLVKLEKYLFTPAKAPKNLKEKLQKFEEIQHYLINNSIETIPTFIAEITTELTETKILKGFYWMIIQIIIQNFHTKAKKWEFSDCIDKTKWKLFKENIKIETKRLQTELEEHAGNIIEQKQYDWLIKKLSTNE